ncbi:MAG: rRNA pseudouridine synthase [Clostridia bacterium]|nr:rRNA pseudouridine synthase [Clostridia bacterium]
MEQQTVRLQKYFTDCGVLSRRAAEEEIRAGRVTVNGTVAEIGQRICPESDTVVWRGKKIRPTATAHHYILLNKPRGFVTTLSDEKGRPTVADLVQSVGARVYPVGRLDMDSDGLLLLTDDGDLANRLTHPKHGIPKIYHVTVQGFPTNEMMRCLQAPFDLDGYQTQPVTVRVFSMNEKTTTLAFWLVEGRNRQIRRMCEAVGLTITRLTRVSIGSIKLDTLKEGAYRHLSPTEVAYLKGK